LDQFELLFLYSLRCWEFNVGVDVHLSVATSFFLNKVATSFC